MVDIQLADDGQLERAEKMLAGIGGGFDRAVKSAMSRTVSSLRANATRAIQERYDISRTALRTEQNISVRYVVGQGVQAFVTFRGHKIPLYRYGGSAPKKPTVNGSVWVDAMVAGFWKRVHPSLSAKGHQLKSTSPYHFDDAFVAQMSSGHIGIFERTGGSTAKGGDAIRELMGSSIPQMLGSPDVQAILSEKAAEKFSERLDHEVDRLLSGLY